MAQKVILGLGNTRSISTVGGVGLSVTPVGSAPSTGVQPDGNVGRAPTVGLSVGGTDATGVDLGSVITSLDSAVVFHSTLFEDFDLTATPTYNFYVSDETVDPVQDVSASLGSTARYVTLSWNTVPTRQVLISSRKGQRPTDPRAVGVAPVLRVVSAKAAVANGYVSPGTVVTLLVPPSVMTPTVMFSEDLFLSTPSTAGGSAADNIDQGSDFHTAPADLTTTRTRVNFVDPSIAGALDPNRITVSTDHVQLATLGALSKLTPSLEVISEFNQDIPIRNPPPTFPAPPQSPGLSYIGYTVERYTLDQSGSMTADMTIDIDDPSQSSWVDRNVLYGGRYAYRIRTIVQWTHPPNIGFFGASTIDTTPVFNPINLNSLIASFYNGDWSDWSRTQLLDTVPPAPPDELTVRPVSWKDQVHVSWKMPWNPRQDIAALRLLRSTRVDGRYTDWTQLGEYVPGNGLYIDTDVVPHEQSRTSYMYAMYSVSYHGLRSVLSERVQTRLTSRSKYLGEEPVDLIAPMGADPMMHASGPGSAISTELIASTEATFYIRGTVSSLPLFRRNYVVEVQSLATGERVELNLSAETTDVD